MSKKMKPVMVPVAPIPKKYFQILRRLHESPSNFKASKKRRRKNIKKYKIGYQRVWRDSSPHGRSSEDLVKEIIAVNDSEAIKKAKAFMQRKRAREKMNEHYCVFEFYRLTKKERIEIITEGGFCGICGSWTLLS